MAIIEPSPDQLGEMLYRLHFPTKKFADLPDAVKASYRTDATCLLGMWYELKDEPAF